MLLRGPEALDECGRGVLSSGHPAAVEAPFATKDAGVPTITPLDSLNDNGRRPITKRVRGLHGDGVGDRIGRSD